MIDRTKTIVVNILATAIIAITLFAAATQYRQWAQYKRGQEALARGDHVQAIAGYESSIHMYTPFSPLVERSAAKLWAIGEYLEAHGESEQSLVAYRALRSAFYSTHSLFRPGTRWIAACDAKIKGLVKPLQPSK
jgi:tetratricopeptide (TPR) repeat protein